MVGATPTAVAAAAAAERTTGMVPRMVRRFRIGASHFVYEARFRKGAAVVIRMGLPDQRGVMADGLRLARTLRVLGVPLPEVFMDGLDQPWPWVAMGRLAGTDLGGVMASLSDRQLRGVATRVNAAQLSASAFGSAGRYGYATAAGAAPHASWSGVLDANLLRSARRLTSAGSFDLSVVSTVAGLVHRRRCELDALPAVQFLHDTTTRNVIVRRRGHFSGIVDVDDLCFGDPRFAPALTLAVLLAYGGPARYVETWMDVAAYRGDRIFWLYVALFAVDLMSEHGQRFNGNEIPSNPERRNGLLNAFRHALERASG